MYSSLDLKSAYYQILIVEEDKPYIYTAFEACGKLYQFKRIPFDVRNGIPAFQHAITGVRNGVPAFQQAITGIISIEGLKGVEVYLDNITICDHNQDEHDKNLKQFMEVVSKYNLTLNMDKSNFSIKEIHLLGYVLSYKCIHPDPERLQPIRKSERTFALTPR